MHALKQTIFRREDPSAGIRVIRSSRRQIRARLNKTLNGEEIVLRFQPRTPPPLGDCFKGSPAVVEALRNATGLVVVCGPQGAGKSTLASSIVEIWANEKRHIRTIEDPVEYLLDPIQGIVSSVEVSFSQNDSPGASPLDAALRDALRSDIDGLMVGEVRTGPDMASTLNVCGAREPVVTTLHARSIMDAILRILNLASKHMDDDVARRSLAQCLDTILYVDLAYSKEGRPVPVVLSAPFGAPSIRKNIAEGTRSSMLQALTTAFEGGMVPGTIRKDVAIDNAKRSGGTEASILAALPPSN
ncbi:MAG: Flp pilus assembly complex ATPase component TadA [Opitutaceae bacterium]|nr:Flp pilus assembly complex ATPase component TadA [Opitutaceae bacterium]